MVPSKLNVIGYDQQHVYLRTADGQDVFVEWRELPIGEALANDAVRTAAQELHDIRREAARRGMEAIERALSVVTELKEREQLQDAYDSLAESNRSTLVEQD